jgi:hypothetical protein
MPSSVRILGTGQLVTLSARLRSAGGPRLRSNFARRIRRAAEPLQRDLQQAVRTMPLRADARRTRPGGPSPTTRPFRQMLAEGVRLSVRTTSSPSARVWIDRSRIEPKARNVLNQIENTGRLRHPVFGHDRRWVNQRAPSNWWSRTVRAGTPRMTAEVARVVEDVRRSLQ